MPKPVNSSEPQQLNNIQKKPAAVSSPKNRGGLFAGLESDDMLLIAVLLILFADDCDDKLLIAAIAFLLFINDK